MIRVGQTRGGSAADDMKTADSLKQSDHYSLPHDAISSRCYLNSAVLAEFRTRTDYRCSAANSRRIKSLQVKSA